MKKTYRTQIEEIIKRRDRLIKEIGSAPTATPSQAKEFQAIRAEIQKLFLKISRGIL